MATIAVFVALGGSSYAALRVTSRHVPRDALTGADVKNLTGRDVRNNSLTGADVKRLTGADFAPGQLPRGEPGPAGPAGPAGAAGPPGSARAYARVTVDATGLTLDAANSKGMETAQVTTPDSATVCFDGLGFDPKAVTADVENAGLDYGFVLTNANSTNGSCPGSEDAAIAVREPGGTPHNGPGEFFVATVVFN
jgi:hypothetical protein